MTGIRTSFEYTLEEPIKYSEKGEFQEGEMLVLYAPSMKQSKYAAKISQDFMHAKIELQSSDFMKNLKTDEDLTPEEKAEIKEAKIEKSDEEKTRDMVKGNIETLKMSEFSLYEMLELFKKLMCSGVCKIEDKNTITDEQCGSLPMSVLENLLGEYVYRFLDS